MNIAEKGQSGKQSDPDREPEILEDIIPFDLPSNKAETSSKSRSKAIYWIIIILLTASLAFAFGRLSKLEEGREQLTISYKEQAATIVSAKSRILASKNGSKYYYPWCNGATRISQKNIIWFTSRENAEQAGYAKASNCLGLN